MQALQDAVAIRKMIFGLLPEIRTVELRAFRQSAREPPGLDHLRHRRSARGGSGESNFS